MAIPYYRFFPGDYARDTRHLSLMQHGVYRLLIDLYMDQGGALRNDLQWLYRWLHAESVEEKNAVEFILGEFFMLRDNKWQHKRCEVEIAWREGKSAEARASVAKRWNNERSSDDIRTYYGRNTNQNQNQNHKIQKPKARRVAAIAPAALPDWLPVNEWKSFLEHRKALRKKMTPHAQELAIKTLEALRTAGQDVAAVLNQSIERGWQGLFEVSNGLAPPKQGSKVAAPKVDNGWMFSEQGTVAKGREFGLEARAGESWNDFRGRIHAKIWETTE